MTSHAASPAWLAGLFETISERRAHDFTGSPRLVASSGVSGAYRIPINARSICPFLITEARIASTVRAESGIANPIPFAPAETAVFIPTTRPSIPMRGPPEFPGLIAASVWMRPESCSTHSPPPSAAWICRPSPEITPRVTVF